MSAWYLFIAGLLFLTLLYPGRVLHFIRTIRVWLVRRKAHREAWQVRKDEIYRANVEWKRYLDEEHERLLELDTLEGKVDVLRRSLAAGERYLKSVSPDECPSNYKKTDAFCRWAEKKLAEVDAEQQ